VALAGSSWRFQWKRIMITRVSGVQRSGPFRLVMTGLAVACIAVALMEGLAMAHQSIGDLVVALAIVSWNCIPMLVALRVAVATRTRGNSLRFACYGFALGAAGLSLFVHIMWAFDVGKIATGSSTSALVFLFLPFYAGVCGLLVAVPAGIINHLVGVYRDRLRSR
jgi:hypothetical protein